MTGAAVWTRHVTPDVALPDAAGGLALPTDGPAIPTAGPTPPADGPAIPTGPTVHRILPDGCVDLIWCDGALTVAGPDTRAVLVPARPDAHYVAIRFPPGVGPAALGVPADELRDRRVPLESLWPAALVRQTAERIAVHRTPGAVLEDIALARLAEREPDPAARYAAARLDTGATVAAVAGEIGLSDRQLRRRCVSAFGYGPKTLARILRLQRALALAREGEFAAAAVAAITGYADQAHLAREVRALAGVPLRDL